MTILYTPAEQLMFLEPKQLMGYQFVLHNSALWHDLERKCVYCFFWVTLPSFVLTLEIWKSGVWHDVMPSVL